MPPATNYMPAGQPEHQSEGVPSRGIRSLGAMGQGPGRPRFFRVAARRRVVAVVGRPPKTTLGHLDKNGQK